MKKCNGTGLVLKICETKNNVWKKYRLSIQNSIDNHIKITYIKPNFASLEYESVSKHMTKALELYSDRKKPDYENSVKESISSVESMCSIITGLSGGAATLGNTLKKLKENGVNIHPALENAFKQLYGYTSDSGGIRHGSIEFVNVASEDAKYMLVSCSAFVNYLTEKWIKYNLK